MFTISVTLKLTVTYASLLQPSACITGVTKLSELKFEECTKAI
jgi:hypothetical protein